jgi:DNA-binding transcriptional MocR family regulator
MRSRAKARDEVDDPKYLQLARRFEKQMRTGVLRVGDRLPSVRQLHVEHNVSVATAVGCYVWLERQGYVRARPRSGFYVRHPPDAELVEPSIARRPRGPVTVQIPATLAPQPVRLPMGMAVIGPELLPRTRINRSLRLALSAFADHAMRYDDPRGNVRLRRQLARLAFRQGITCTPDDILVTTGATEAFNLSVRAVARPGDIIAVESPGCYRLLQALETLGMRAVEIPHVAGRGMSLDWLKAVVGRHPVKAVLVTATCQSPTGDVGSDESMEELVAFATEAGLAVIESDMFGELVWNGERPRSLKSFDTSGIVLYCASLAHYVAPGLNLGWLVAGRWQDDVVRMRASASVGSAALPQLAMAEFLESGAFDKHVRRLRRALADIVPRAREEILRLFPAGTRVTSPGGGFVLWVQLPPGYDGTALTESARRAGIEILAGEMFSAAGQYRDCVRIACGHPLDKVRQGIRVLAKLLADEAGA